MLGLGNDTSDMPLSGFCTGALLHLGNHLGSSTVLWLWQLLVHCRRVCSGTVGPLQETRFPEHSCQHRHNCCQCICCVSGGYHQVGHDCGVCPDCMEWPAHRSWRHQHSEAEHPALTAVGTPLAAVNCTFRVPVCVCDFTLLTATTHL